MEPISRRDAVKAFSLGAGLAAAAPYEMADEKKDAAVVRLQHYTARNGAPSLLPLGNPLRIPVARPPITNCEHVAIYSVELRDLKPGELLFVTAQVEVESKIPTNVLIAHHIVLADSPRAQDGLSIAAATGTNIVNRPEKGGVWQHYYTATSCGSLAITVSAQRKFVNFLAYSACDAQIPASERFLVAKPYAGSMTVLRFVV